MADPKIDINLAEGQHVSQNSFDPIPAGAKGTEDHPYILVPNDMADNGLPYGAWCRCGRCGILGRSTLVFDFYMRLGVGKPLVCEKCVHGMGSKGGCGYRRHRHTEIEQMRRFHHFPERVKELAMDDPGLYALMRAYQAGEVNYVAILESMVIHQTETVNRVQEKLLKYMREDTKAPQLPT